MEVSLMKKAYSLCVNKQVLERLKAKKTKIIQHVVSRQWANFNKKKHKTVRLYDQMCMISGTFIVIESKEITQLGERVIRIELGDEINL